MTSDTHPARRVLANVCTAAAALALSALAIEGGFGLLNRVRPGARPRPPHGEMSVFTRYHPILGWDGVPGVHERLIGKWVTQNTRGERGPDLPEGKPPGVKRVVVLGDSQAWGLGVGDDETIAAQLERRLGARGDARWQVLNLGVSGYGTDQAYLKHVLRGARYEPDVVVEIVFKNDLSENEATHVWGVEKPRFFFDAERLCLGNLPPPKVPGWPEDALGAGGVRLFGRRIDLSWSATYRFFETRSWRLARPRPPDPDEMARLRDDLPCLESRAAGAADGPRIMLALLRRLDARTRARGARLVVLFVPRPVEVRKPRRATYYDAVQVEVAAAGIAVLDLRRVAATAGLDADTLFLPRDAHLSVAGSALAAQAVFNSLH